MEERELVKEKILVGMQNNKEIKAEYAFGKFALATRKSYTYSPKITDLEEKVKLAKLKEQEKGLAKVKETPYLIFKENKDDIQS